VIKLFKHDINVFKHDKMAEDHNIHEQAFEAWLKPNLKVRDTSNVYILNYTKIVSSAGNCHIVMAAEI
jgi:hypothetical protein